MTGNIMECVARRGCKSVASRVLKDRLTVGLAVVNEVEEEEEEKVVWARKVKQIFHHQKKVC